MVPDVTNRDIYMLRNPLDVALSFANHIDVTIEKAIEMIAGPEMRMAKQMPDAQLPQVEQPLGAEASDV